MARHLKSSKGANANYHKGTTGKGVFPFSWNGVLLSRQFQKEGRERKKGGGRKGKILISRLKWGVVIDAKKSSCKRGKDCSHHVKRLSKE